jgi:hypothetical protein
MSDPRLEGGRELLGSLLSPVRCGIILTRNDLARLARDRGLAHRAGERSFLLEALLGQDAAGTLSWIAAEADRWTRPYSTLPEVLSPIGEFWTSRARRCGDLLRQLMSDV